MGRRLCLLLGSLVLVGATTVVAAEDRAVRSATGRARSESQAEEVVSFNVKSHKFHCRACLWAKRCTANCVDIRVSDAKRRGGVACKICGGSCRG